MEFIPFPNLAEILFKILDQMLGLELFLQLRMFTIFFINMKNIKI